MIAVAGSDRVCVVEGKEGTTLLLKFRSVV